MALACIPRGVFSSSSSLFFLLFFPPSSFKDAAIVEGDYFGRYLRIGTVGDPGSGFAWRGAAHKWPIKFWAFSATFLALCRLKHLLCAYAFPLLRNVGRLPPFWATIIVPAI